MGPDCRQRGGGGEGGAAILWLLLLDARSVTEISRVEPALRPFSPVLNINNSNGGV